MHGVINPIRPKRAYAHLKERKLSLDSVICFDFNCVYIYTGMCMCVVSSYGITEFRTAVAISLSFLHIYVTEMWKLSSD